MEGFLYVEVKIAPEIENIVPLNHDPMVQSITESLKRWTPISVSVSGHINIPKM